MIFTDFRKQEFNSNRLSHANDTKINILYIKIDVGSLWIGNYSNFENQRLSVHVILLYSFPLPLISKFPVQSLNAERRGLETAYQNSHQMIQYSDGMFKEMFQFSLTLPFIIPRTVLLSTIQPEAGTLDFLTQTKLALSSNLVMMSRVVGLRRFCSNPICAYFCNTV